MVPIGGTASYWKSRQTTATVPRTTSRFLMAGAPIPQLPLPTWMPTSSASTPVSCASQTSRPPGRVSAGLKSTMECHSNLNYSWILSFHTNDHALGIPKGDACVTKRSKNYHEFIMNNYLMIIRNRTTKAPKGQQTTGRGATPVNGSVHISPERAAESLCHPFGVAFTPLTYRGCTPACDLISPSGFGGTIADNHNYL